MKETIQQKTVIRVTIELEEGDLESLIIDGLKARGYKDVADVTFQTNSYGAITHIVF